MTKVSVVIRTYNEAASIERTLRAVLDQREVEPEIIVVDSGSSDGTVGRVAAFPTRLIALPHEQFSYGRALNLGFAAASAPVVVSLSAHALPFDRHWLRNLVRPLADPLVDGVVGKTIPFADCNPFDRRGLRRQYGTKPRCLIDGRVPGFSNANSAVRRRAWEEDPFDETLPFSEDVRWARRRLGLGRRLVYAPDAVAYHSHNETPEQLYRRFWGESRAREAIDPRGARYAKHRLLWDLLAGTVYDWGTLLRRREARAWWLVAWRRRVAINLGRYAGSRGLARLDRRRVWSAILARPWLRWLRRLGSLAGRLAPRVVAMTRKHPLPLHPKHLLPESRDHFWYADELAGGRLALDIGCNVGAHSRFVARQGLAVIGLDVDPKILKHAQFVLRWENAAKALVLQADANRPLPLADRSCDRVLAFDVIEHVEDADFFLAETARVLAPEGRLLITAPNAETTWKKRFRRAGLPFFADVSHRVEFTRRGFWQALEKAGFVVLRDEPIVADTPAAPWFDLLGSFSMKIYARLAERKRRRALAAPAESTGFRVVARKAGG